ncbi:UNVERIFIED_CONTAM: hypothetical protein O8I53_05320 [Campylobacter lari]
MPTTNKITGNIIEYLVLATKSIFLSFSIQVSFNKSFMFTPNIFWFSSNRAVSNIIFESHLPQTSIIIMLKIIAKANIIEKLCISGEPTKKKIIVEINKKIKLSNEAKNVLLKAFLIAFFIFSFLLNSRLILLKKGTFVKRMKIEPKTKPNNDKGEYTPFKATNTVKVKKIVKAPKIMFNNPNNPCEKINDIDIIANTIELAIQK